MPLSLVYMCSLFEENIINVSRDCSGDSGSRWNMVKLRNRVRGENEGSCVWARV